MKEQNNFLKNVYNYLFFMNSIYPNININIEKRDIANSKIPLLEELLDFFKNNDAMDLYYKIKPYSDNPKSYKFKKAFISSIEYNFNLKNRFLEYILNKYSNNIPTSQKLLYKNSYTSLLHLIIINKFIKFQNSITFNYKSENVEIANDNPILIYTEEKTSLLQDPKWIRQLIYRYCFFNYLLKNNDSPKTLQIFLVDFPKQLYPLKNNTVIGPSEINTGLTNGVDILITRKEEALKTLIHELIHFHNMDIRFVPKKINDLLENEFSQINNMVSYNMKLNLFEAYTEFTASIYNICLSSILNDEINNSLMDSEYLSEKSRFSIFKKYYKTELKKQIQHNEEKCSTLLEHFSCDYINNCKITLYTNMISYYFIKNIFYRNLNETFRFLDNSNLSFKNTYKSFNIMYNLIKNYCAKNKYKISTKNNHIQKKTYTHKNTNNKKNTNIKKKKTKKLQMTLLAI